MDRDERTEWLIELRQAGYTFGAIAKIIGISKTAAFNEAAGLVRAGRLVPPREVICSNGTRQPTARFPRGQMALPDRCTDCGERRNEDDAIAHLIGCERPWL